MLKEFQLRQKVGKGMRDLSLGFCFAVVVHVAFLIISPLKYHIPELSVDSGRSCIEVNLVNVAKPQRVVVKPINLPDTQKQELTESTETTVSIPENNVPVETESTNVVEEAALNDESALPLKEAMETQAVVNESSAQPISANKEIEQREQSEVSEPSPSINSVSNPELGLDYVAPSIISNPAPVYPRKARLKGIHGQVLLRVFIRDDGSCGNVFVLRSSGYNLLDNSAIKAVSQWKFSPARRSDLSESASIDIPVVFELER